MIQKIRLQVSLYILVKFTLFPTFTQIQGYLYYTGVLISP